MSVGTRAIPSRFIRATSSSVRKMPCSMEVIPASMQLAIPWEPWAWAATRRPAFVASSMAARTSSSVSWADPGSTPGVITPPVAKILMTSAPALSCSLTARRTSSGPPPPRPTPQPWPPVMQMPRRAARIRGPGTTPSPTARRTANSAYSRPPRSRTVVTPASTVSRARTAILTAVSVSGSSRSRVTGSGSPPRQRWKRALMSPGGSVRPARRSAVPGGAPRSSTTAAIRAPSTTTALSLTGWAPLPSISVAPLRISRSPPLARGGGAAAPPPVRQHPPPGGRGWLDAEAQERQRRFHHDYPCHVQRGHDEPGGEGVGENVPDEPPPIPASERDRGLDELPLAQRQHFPPHDPRVDDPARHPDDDDDIPEAGPEHADHRDRQQDERERQLDVGQAHEHVVHPPAEVAGDEPDGHPEGPRNGHRGAPDQERDAGAVDDPRQDVAAQVVGPQQVHPPRGVLPARRPEPMDEVLLQGIGGRDQRRDDGAHDDDEDDRQAEQRRPPADQPPQQGEPLVFPAGAGADQDKGLGCLVGGHRNPAGG